MIFERQFSERKSLVAVSLCLLACACGHPGYVHAGETFFDRSTWETRVGNFVLEDFEQASTGEIPLNTSVSVGLVEVLLTGTVKSRSNSVDGFGSNDIKIQLADNPLAGRPHVVTEVRFTLPGPTIAWGADFAISAEDVQDRVLVSTADSSYNFQSDGVSYFGFFGTIESVPFDLILFTLELPTADGGGFRLDNLSFQLIPEPSSIIIGVVGLLSIAVFPLHGRR